MTWVLARLGRRPLRGTAAPGILVSDPQRTEPGRCVPMRAAPGDRLIIHGDCDRVGEVIGVPHGDGPPPYVVRWRRGGHIALVSPDNYTVIIPANGDDSGA